MTNTAQPVTVTPAEIVLTVPEGATVTARPHEVGVAVHFDFTGVDLRFETLNGARAFALLLLDRADHYDRAHRPGLRTVPAVTR